MSILKQNDNTSDRDLIKLCGFNVYQHSKNKGNTLPMSNDPFLTSFIDGTCPRDTLLNKDLLWLKKMEGADLECKARTMDLMEPFLDFDSKSCVDISLFFDIMICMELIEIFKALSNESRLQILQWLKEPDRHFTPHEGIDMNTTGVCVSQITDKLKMTQSTASQYLSILQRAGLITAERIGKYTYYKRDEEAIKKIATLFEKNI